MEQNLSIREALTAAAVGAGRGGVVAERLCNACVELLDIDGATLTVMRDGATSGLLGASSPAGRELDELQYTTGEGPCLDAARGSLPVVVEDMRGSHAQRWPSFAAVAARRGIGAVLCLPVTVAGFPIGVLTFSRSRSGTFDTAVRSAGIIAAELAVLPLLDLMGIDLDSAVTDDTSTDWEELAGLARVEVYQASGMLIAQLGVSPAEALARLRGYAFAHDKSTSEVAYEVLERRLKFGPDDGGATLTDGEEY